MNTIEIGLQSKDNVSIPRRQPPGKFNENPIDESSIDESSIDESSIDTQISKANAPIDINKIIATTCLCFWMLVTAMVYLFIILYYITIYIRDEAYNEYDFNIVSANQYYNSEYKYLLQFEYANYYRYTDTCYLESHMLYNDTFPGCLYQKQGMKIPHCLNSCPGSWPVGVMFGFGIITCFISTISIMVIITKCK